MTERQLFEISADDFNVIMEEIDAARKVSGMFLSGGEPMANVQEAANSAWRKLGEKMGFDPMTVEQATEKGPRAFTAIPTGHP